MRCLPRYYLPKHSQGTLGLCQVPTNLAVICLPGQEAAASTSVPDTDLARAGAAVEQGVGPIAERGQFSCPHLLRDWLLVHLAGHKNGYGSAVSQGPHQIQYPKLSVNLNT